MKQLLILIILVLIIAVPLGQAGMFTKKWGRMGKKAIFGLKSAKCKNVISKTLKKAYSTGTYFKAAKRRAKKKVREVK